jgi:hypothetical protein
VQIGRRAGDARLKACLEHEINLAAACQVGVCNEAISVGRAAWDTEQLRGRAARRVGSAVATSFVLKATAPAGSRQSGANSVLGVAWAPWRGCQRPRKTATHDTKNEVAQH